MLPSLSCGAQAIFFFLVVLRAVVFTGYNLEQKKGSERYIERFYLSCGLRCGKGKKLQIASRGSRERSNQQFHGDQLSFGSTEGAYLALLLVVARRGLLSPVGSVTHSASLPLALPDS